MVLQANKTHKANNFKQLTYLVTYVNHFSENVLILKINFIMKSNHFTCNQN